MLSIWTWMGDFKLQIALKKQESYSEKKKSCTKSEKLLEGLKVAPIWKVTQKLPSNLCTALNLRAAEEKQNGFCRYIVINKVTLWCASYSACVVYTKRIIHLSVGESSGYLPPLQWIIVKYSRFIWLNGSMSLIRAETERHDIVGFSKVTTKSLASGTGS